MVKNRGGENGMIFPGGENGISHVGNQMCWCQVRDVDDQFRMLGTD